MLATGYDLEITFVDDVSSDGSIEVVSMLMGGGNIRLICHKRNRGNDVDTPSAPVWKTSAATFS
jgi:hypothetical protein